MKTKTIVLLFAIMLAVSVMGSTYIASAEGATTVTTAAVKYDKKDLKVKRRDGSYKVYANGEFVKYTGFVENFWGTKWFAKNGIVNKNYNGVYKNKYIIKRGRLDEYAEGLMPVAKKWGYVKNGVVQRKYTGVQSNEYGDWFVKKGYVDFDYSGQKKIKDDVYVIKDGAVDKSYTALEETKLGWGYIKEGKLAKDYSGVQSNQYGNWYVSNGLVDFTYTGKADSEGKSYFFKDGKIDTSVNGIIGEGNRWGYYVNGIVDDAYTGVRSNGFGRWYIDKGYVDFTKNDIVTSDGATYYTREGKVDTTQNSILELADGSWAKFNEGVVNTNFTGVATNEYGSWFIRKGYVDFGYNGSVTSNGQRYKVVNGRANSNTSGNSQSSNGSSSSSSTSYGRYDASWKSKPRKFHRVNGCGGERNIVEQNKVYFDSYQEAIDAGYSPCKVCFG